MSDDMKLSDVSKKDVQEVIDSVFGMLTPEESKAIENSVNEGLKLKEVEV
jgi:hypothetical protein